MAEASAKLTTQEQTPKHNPGAQASKAFATYKLLERAVHQKAEAEKHSKGMWVNRDAQGVRT